jgi:hypothetical protein
MANIRQRLDSRVADGLGQTGQADNTDNVQKLLPHSKIRLFRVRQEAADRLLDEQQMSPSGTRLVAGEMAE